MPINMTYYINKIFTLSSLRISSNEWNFYWSTLYLTPPHLNEGIPIISNNICCYDIIDNSNRNFYR